MRTGVSTLLLTALLVIIAALVVGYFLGKVSSPQLGILPPFVPPPQPSQPPTVPSTPKPEPVVIPRDWKEFTAKDPEFKLETTLSLPPNFSFSFTGSEFTIQSSDAQELWDYSTSIFNGKDGLNNYYDGGSRRVWYQRRLDGEFNVGESGAIGEIVSVTEYPSGIQTYLEVLVKIPQGKTEKHYLFVQNNIVNIIKPVSQVADSSDAELSTYINLIFASLSVRQLP